MKALGLNPGEQEMIDMTNEVAVNGLVYFPDFCRLVTRKYREDSRELLNQAFFKVILELNMQRQINHDIKVGKGGCHLVALWYEK